MNQPSFTLDPAEVVRILWARRWQWLIPAGVCATLALVAALIMPRTWQATQAMVVRDEAAGAGEGTGRFRAADDMKDAQETVMELAKSRTVIEAALKKVGPAERGDAANWPTPQGVADLRDAISLAPPKGAEFGTTEVFYLQVKDVSPERAIALNKALSAEVQLQLQKLRDDKAVSTIAELERGTKLAEKDLETSTQALSKLEGSIGGDLAELRLLNGGNNGDSDLRRKTVEMENQLRDAKLARQQNEKLLALLVAAEKDQAQLLATPNQLLESQPALRRLKDGLIDAQLRTAQLRGNMSDTHPQVMAATAAEKNVADQVHLELANAVRGVQVDLDLNAGRIALLQGQVNENQQRLQNLATVRASYANLAAEVTQRSDLLQKARAELAAARASQAGAQGPGVITLIDTPDVGNRPIGPGRATIVLGGFAGGLAIGLGWVFLTVPLPRREIQAETPVTTPRKPTTPAESSLAGLRGALSALSNRPWSAGA